MMQTPAGHYFLRLLGCLLATAGALAWIGLAWKAFTDLDDVTAHSDEGGRLMAWALTGTVLMIVGMVILHIAQAAAEGDEQGERDRSRL